jgi:hypothetical protein
VFIRGVFSGKFCGIFFWDGYPLPLRYFQPTSLIRRSGVRHVSSVSDFNRCNTCNTQRFCLSQDDPATVRYRLDLTMILTSIAFAIAA